MAALSTRPAFLLLLLASNMAYSSPVNDAPLSCPVPWDKGGGGAVAALGWPALPAGIGSGGSHKYPTDIIAMRV